MHKLVEFHRCLHRQARVNAEMKKGVEIFFRLSSDSGRDTGFVVMKSNQSTQDMREALTNRYVRICSDMYHFGVSGDMTERIEAFLGDRNTTNEAIAFLKNEYRQHEVIDRWSPLEMALFTAGVARFGRDWESVKSILPHKSAPEMSDFYYSVWKGSTMGEACRKLRKQRGLDIG